MFDLIKKIQQEILKSIENTGIFAVKQMNSRFSELRDFVSSKTFDVKVVNPQEKVEVKGTVVVGNQQRLEKKMEEVSSLLKKTNKTLPSLKTVKVSNQKAFPKFPKSISISNLSNKTRVENLNIVVDALGEIQKVVSKMKLDPQINVKVPKQEAPIVNVPEQPAPVVKVTQNKVDMSAITDLLEFWQSLTKTAKKSLSVRLTDGDKFYKAVDELVDAVANNSSHFQYYSGGEARPIVNGNNELQVTSSDTWEVNDTKQESSSLTYYGEESVSGLWRIRKVELTGGGESIRFATVKNNSLAADYELAWSSRDSLTYGTTSQAS